MSKTSFPLKKIDESEVVDNVQRGKEKADHIVEELNILDEYGVSQLEQTKQDLDTMLNYLTEIESKFQTGDLSIRNFNVKAIQGLESFQTIQDSIYNKNQETISGYMVMISRRCRCLRLRRCMLMY